MDRQGALPDDKAKRTRDLLSSFYSSDFPSITSGSFERVSLDTINTPSFDVDQYMNLLVRESSLEGLLQKHVEMASEIKNIGTDLQMLIYENYNKFICATDTIKRMTNNIVGMEVDTEQLLDKMLSVQSSSDTINSSLFEKRGHIEKLHRTRNLLHKIKFICGLPDILGKCIKSEEYADAVRFYTGAIPFFKMYGNCSFRDCQQSCDEAMSIVRENLKEKLLSEMESIQTRSKAASLLAQLNFPVDSLRAILLNKLEVSLNSFSQNLMDIDVFLEQFDDSPLSGENPHRTVVEHYTSVRDFANAIHGHLSIFPLSEKQMKEICQDFITVHFQTIEDCIKNRKHISASNFMMSLRIFSQDTQIMSEVLHDLMLSEFSIKASFSAVKQFVSTNFLHHRLDVSDALTTLREQHGETVDDPIRVALEVVKKLVLEGSLSLLSEFHQLLDSSLALLVQMRNSIFDMVQEEFQNFFFLLNEHFLLLAGIRTPAGHIQGRDKKEQSENVSPHLVSVLSQLSSFVEQVVVPRVTEEVADSFCSGNVRGRENGPAFIPGEICRLFRSSSEKLLLQYINMRARRISVILRKRFTATNWVKHKEPREVHMFVDLFLQELDAIRNEVRQVLPKGIVHKHLRSESNGSTTSSCSNMLRDDKTVHSSSQKGRSHLLETHLAKLFKQKVEIFTKVEHTQESVTSAIVKLSLKSLQEFVRLQTFNRSGFQQMQLDIQFMRNSLLAIVDDEAVTDFLLEEVIVAASERSLDPVPLEPPILDMLIGAKVDKMKSQMPFHP